MHAIESISKNSIKTKFKFKIIYITNQSPSTCTKNNTASIEQLSAVTDQLPTAEMLNAGNGVHPECDMRNGINRGLNNRVALLYYQSRGVKK